MRIKGNNNQKCLSDPNLGFWPYQLTFFEIIYQMSKVVRKSRNETRTSKVSDTRKADLSIVAFHIRYFAAQVQKAHIVNNAKKWTRIFVLKKVTCKNFELWKWSIFVNKTSKQLQKFFISDVLFTIINHFQSSKILHVTFFWGHLLHCPHCLILKRLLRQTLPFRTPLFIFQTNECWKILLFSKFENKQAPPKMFEKGPFLTVYTRWLDSDDVTKCKFWTG